MGDRLLEQPTLIVISGPAGSGKTTLAHARAIGCPPVCRDEIKEGMMHASGGEFVAAPGDPLTMRTLPTFFSVLELLLRAGVTTVAEAAFQDHVWRLGLEPLREIARICVVHCVVEPSLAEARIGQRGLRKAHADGSWVQGEFNRLSLDVPSLEVETTDGYRPGSARSFRS